MGKLVEEGILSRTGKDIYAMNKKKLSAFEFPDVKEEMDCPMIAEGGKTSPGSCEDHMYMKALYHALPMDYVTVSKLQNKLEGEANQNTVRKLIDKMAKEGYLEAKSNRRLGKRVIRSNMTEKKLTEVKKALEIEAMDIDITESHNKTSHAVDPQADSHMRDMSTCGGIHSIGSDLTRTKDQSNILQNGSQTTSKAREQGNTPTSRAELLQPVASRESFTQKRRTVEKPVYGDEDGAAICSKSSQDKRSRKTSTVKEPILQYLKRQRSAL